MTRFFKYLNKGEITIISDDDMKNNLIAFSVPFPLNDGYFERVLNHWIMMKNAHELKEEDWLHLL